MATRVLLGREGVTSVPLAVITAVVAAAMSAIAVVSPVAALAAVIGVGFVALAVCRLVTAIAVFTVFVFMEALPGVAGAGGVSAVKIAGAVLAFAWVLRTLAAHRDVALLRSEQLVVVSAAAFFLAWALASSLWAADVQAALSAIGRLAQGALFAYIVLTAVKERQHVTWLAGAFVVGASLTALAGVVMGTYTDGVRLEGAVGDPNELAAMVVPALALALFLAGARRGRAVRALLVVAAGLLTLSLLMTQSRGGVVALAVAFAAAIVLAGPFRPHAVAAMLAVAGTSAAYYTLIAPDALKRILEFRAGGGTGRTDRWAIAVRMIEDHPLRGVGVGNFQLLEPRYAAEDVNLLRPDLVIDSAKATHNTYLHILAELGMVGFTGFAIMVIAATVLALRTIRFASRKGDRELELMGRGVVIGMIGMLAAFTFISAQYEKQLWLFLGLIASLISIARRTRTVGETTAYAPGMRGTVYSVDLQRENLRESQSRHFPFDSSGDRRIAGGSDGSATASGDRSRT